MPLKRFTRLLNKSKNHPSTRKQLNIQKYKGNKQKKIQTTLGIEKNWKNNKINLKRSIMSQNVIIKDLMVCSTTNNIMVAPDKFSCKITCKDLNSIQQLKLLLLLLLLKF